MLTYLLLNLIVIGLCMLVLARLGWLRWDRAMSIALAVVLLCTALFDSLIIAAGIVDYDRSLLLGVYVGYAPVEDFMYAILAVLIVPTVWKGLGRVRNN